MQNVPTDDHELHIRHVRKFVDSTIVGNVHLSVLTDPYSSPLLFIAR